MMAVSVLEPIGTTRRPPGVVHGYENQSLEPVYFQVMLGRARPELMAYADPGLLERRDTHLRGSTP